MNKYYTISGTYEKKFAGFIPLPYFKVIKNVSGQELQSKGAALKFKEKTGYAAIKGSLLITPYVAIPLQDKKPGVIKDPEIVNNLNLQIMDTKGVDLGYAELVDTLADVVALAMKVGEAVSDGIQLNDAFLLLAEAKNIEEIYKDAPQAFAEFKDLSPEEAALAEAALAARLNAEPGSVVDIIRQAINLITRGYVYFSDVAGFVKQFKKAA